MAYVAYLEEEKIKINFHFQIKNKKEIKSFEQPTKKFFGISMQYRYIFICIHFYYLNLTGFWNLLGLKRLKRKAGIAFIDKSQPIASPLRYRSGGF